LSTNPGRALFQTSSAMCSACARAVLPGACTLQLAETESKPRAPRHSYFHRASPPL
jgi:hypothetical protein